MSIIRRLLKEILRLKTKYFNLFPKTETVTVDGTPVSETQYVYNIQGRQWRASYSFIENSYHP